MLTDDRILKQQPDFFPMSGQGDPRDWPATTLKRDSQFQSKTCIQFLHGQLRPLKNRVVGLRSIILTVMIIIIITMIITTIIIRWKPSSAVSTRVCQGEVWRRRTDSTTKSQQSMKSSSLLSTLDRPRSQKKLRKNVTDTHRTFLLYRSFS